MKKVFIQFWDWGGDPCGASLHVNKDVFSKWMKSNKDLSRSGELEEVEISNNLYFEMLYGDGTLELRQNSLKNLVILGQIKLEREIYAE
jgi:hypothetical protein